MACLQIFGLMNLIIDRLGDSIKPFAEGLLQLLPEVWQDAEGQSLLRIQVSLTTATSDTCALPCGYEAAHAAGSGSNLMYTVCFWMRA